MRRATVCFDEDVHKALRIKSLESDRTLSDIVNDAVRQALAEDNEDSAAISDRKREKSLSCEAFLRGLKSRGQIWDRV